MIVLHPMKSTCISDTEGLINPKKAYF